MCPRIDACGVVIGEPDVCQLGLQLCGKRGLDAGQMLTEVLKAACFVQIDYRVGLIFHTSHRSAQIFFCRNK